MNTSDNNNTSVCANCGKEGDDVNNTCNKCKMVKYCNAACKKKHRHKHKKECEEHVRLAAEHAAKLNDEKLFKQPPPLHEDCPICFLRLPYLVSGRRYQSCCGKVICTGCCFAPIYDDQGNVIVEKTCAFCRVPMPETDEESIERDKKRMEANDAIAIHNAGLDYMNGTNVYQQDYKKALELFHRAKDLGCTEAYCSISLAYLHGRGAEVDKKKAVHYCELAAMGGDVTARYNLGIKEAKAGNVDRAARHFIIAVRGGYAKSLERIKQLYSNGHATKEDYMKALQSFQTYLGEIKSEQRDKAAQSDDRFRYY